MLISADNSLQKAFYLFNLILEVIFWTITLLVAQGCIGATNKDLILNKTVLLPFWLLLLLTSSLFVKCLQ